MLLLHTTNMKCHMTYRFVSFPVTLDDLEGHSPVARLFKCNSTNVCATSRTVLTDTSAPRGPSATAELLVVNACSQRYKSNNVELLNADERNNVFGLLTVSDDTGYLLTTQR